MSIARSKSTRCATSIAAICLFTVCLPSLAEDDHGESAPAESSGAFKLDTQRTWLFRSFLPDASDDADSLGLEFNTSWGWGNYDWTSIAYVELADYPVGVPGQPVGNPDPNPAAATGINDLLTAFLISKRSEHHGPITSATAFPPSFRRETTIHCRAASTRWVRRLNTLIPGTGFLLRSWHFSFGRSQAIRTGKTSAC